MTENLVERASLLIQTKRYKEAEKHLAEVLATEPDNAEALSLLALCKSEGGQHAEAIKIMEQVVGRQPDNPQSLYLYAIMLLRNNEMRKSEKFVKEAIAFDPFNADYFALLASIKIQQKEWQEAYDTANKGLEIDAENLACLNLRSTALTKLDRHEESFETIREALNKDPRNDHTHANLGWSQLEKGNHKAALESFRAALQLNPGNEYARAGLVEALKARYLFYRLFLKYSFWMNNLKAKGQWFLIIGAYVGIRILNSVSDSNPDLAVFLKPIVYLYIAFAISTWIITPLSNLFLRLNVYGRYALDDKQLQASNFTGISFALALVGGAMFLFTGNELFLIILFFGVFMMIPLSSMLNPATPGKRAILIAYATGLAVVGLLSIGILAIGADPGSLWTVFVFGILIYQWVANAMITGS
jgi:tetratricopeptide (TPR) repeat protein